MIILLQALPPDELGRWIIGAIAAGGGVVLLMRALSYLDDRFVSRREW